MNRNRLTQTRRDAYARAQRNRSPMRRVKNILSLAKAHPMSAFGGAVAGLFVLLLISVSISAVSGTGVEPQREEGGGELGADATGSVEQVSRDEPPRDVLSEKYEKEVFGDVSLIAEAAIVVDLNSGNVLFEKDADTARPIASITKVMTALVADDILPQTAYVTITPKALNSYGSSGLSTYETWTFSELRDVMLVTSSNDAATAIAIAAGKLIEGEGEPIEKFVNAMNEKADEIGLSDAALFRNPTGLDMQGETVPGAVASPRDIATLFAYGLEEYSDVLSHSRLSKLSAESLSGDTREIENTNILTQSLSGLIASKTGYTILAGANLAVVVDVGFLKPVAIVVLDSTRSGRFDDVRALYGAAREFVEKDRYDY